MFSDKNAVLLSDKLALKLFHTTTNMIGKTIEWDQGRLSGIYTISGIFEAPPSNVSDQFDLLFSSRLYIETYESLYNITDWGSNDPGTYVILRKGTDIRQFNDKIRDFISLKYKALYGTKDLQWIGEMFLRHYSDQHLYDRYDNGSTSRRPDRICKTFLPDSHFHPDYRLCHFYEPVHGKSNREA
ncbi:MAG: ABC transporter permease [Mangrovibacterium sp.]